MRPYPLDGLDYVNCSYRSVSGLIESNWCRNGDRFEWDILIPPNTTAEIYLPTANGFASKQTLTSGRYHLTSKL